MNNKLMITIGELSENTNISSNVESIKIRPSIIRAQEIGLISLIGEALYRFLLDKRTEGGTWTGLTSMQTTLVNDYITPYLIAKSAFNVVERRNFDIANTGIQKVTTERTSPAELSEIKFLLNSFEADADFYAKRMKQFLDCEEDRTDEIFTLYCSTHQNPQPNREAFNHLIYFPNKR